MTAAEKVELAIERPRVPPAFKRPLEFGDREQIRILRIMNGDEPYCSRCYEVWDDGFVRDIGERCRCGGIFVPGAKMEAAWRRWAEIETC